MLFNEKRGRHDADLQSRFEDETVQKAARDLRLSAIVAIIFFPTFGILDYFVYVQLFHYGRHGDRR